MTLSTHVFRIGIMFKQQHIIIRGFGLVSPIGHSAWGTFRSLLAGQTLADRGLELPGDIHPMERARVLGHIGLAQGSADPAVELAEWAVREACTMAEISPEGLPCIIGASKGAINNLHDDSLAVAMGPHGYMANTLLRRLGLGSTTCTVAACASSLYALHQARMQLLSGQAKRMLVITSEGALLPLFIGGYQRLGVLSPTMARPLDQSRDGFTLAQAGAAILLESVDGDELVKQTGGGGIGKTGEDSGNFRPAQGKASGGSGGALVLVDTAVACEGYDLVRAAPQMPALAYIAERLMGQRTIAMLHPHAPGTVEQDAVEMGIHRRFAKAAAVYACKGALGHTLGSAGLVSLVIACLCAHTRRCPPMPWLRDPVEDCLEQNPFEGHGGHAVFAAGFGGSVAGAVIQKI